VSAGPLRIMLVDDSVVIRRLLADTLQGDPEIVVCGTAGDGLAALEKLEGFQPDAIVLDIEMPRLDGIGTLRELRT
jgi:two-component system chemotaxis response regulator CheB